MALSGILAKTNEEEKELLAEEFSEGSPALKKLLLRFWENEINTIGCCAGHENDWAYYKMDIRGKARPVDEEVYKKHRLSPMYKKTEMEHSPFITFEVTNGYRRADLVLKLRYELEKKFDVTVHPFDKYTALFSGISVTLNQFATPVIREQFFDSINDTLVRYHFFTRPIQPQKYAEAGSKKNLLAEQINGAENKARKQNQNKNAEHSNNRTKKNLEGR